MAILLNLVKCTDDIIIWTSLSPADAATLSLSLKITTTNKLTKCINDFIIGNNCIYMGKFVNAMTSGSVW